MSVVHARSAHNRKDFLEDRTVHRYCQAGGGYRQGGWRPPLFLTARCTGWLYWKSSRSCTLGSMRSSTVTPLGGVNWKDDAGTAASGTMSVSTMSFVLP